MIDVFNRPGRRRRIGFTGDLIRGRICRSRIAHHNHLIAARNRPNNLDRHPPQLVGHFE